MSTVRLPPGRFTLDDLPIEAGLGSTRVIIRDTFGREQSLNLGFYLSTRLLKRGEQDYSYVGGLERTSSGTKVEYGRAMGTAVHSVGLADWLTIGFQAEGAKDIVDGRTLDSTPSSGAWGRSAPRVSSASRRQGAGLCSDGRLLLHVDLDSRHPPNPRVTWIGLKFQNLFQQIIYESMHLVLDTGADLALGQQGELGCAPAMMTGYLGNPAASADHRRRRLVAHR